MLIPARTVFISGVPEPSASGLMKYPTDVAIKNKMMEEITQKRKLNTFISGLEMIFFLLSIPKAIMLSRIRRKIVAETEKIKRKDHSKGFARFK
jgi:hypothetical protein